MRPTKLRQRREQLRRWRARAAVMVWLGYGLGTSSIEDLMPPTQGARSPIGPNFGPDLAKVGDVNPIWPEFGQIWGLKWGNSTERAQRWPGNRLNLV